MAVLMQRPDNTGNGVNPDVSQPNVIGNIEDGMISVHPGGGQQAETLQNQHPGADETMPEEGFKDITGSLVRSRRRGQSKTR